MVNYSNGKIYKVEPAACGADGDIYIGSTTKQYLSQRFSTHRSNYQYWKDGKCNKVKSFDLFEKYGIENCVMTLLENVSAASKEELLARERHYIQSLRCLNKVIPLRTHQEYRTDNAQKIKEYRENKKEIIKEYRDNNKEKMKEYNRVYCYIEKLEAIRERNIEKIPCNCGSSISRCNLAVHRKSIKHQRFEAAAAAAEPTNIPL